MKKIITTLALVSMFGLAGIASAQTTGSASSTDVMQTTGTTDTGTSSTSVGVPNTGAGGDAAINFVVLAASAVVAVVAGALALRRTETH